MSLCRRTWLLVLVLYTGRMHFTQALGESVKNFTDCITKGNHMPLDMPIRCVDSKTGMVFYGDVDQIYMKKNMLQKVADRAAQDPKAKLKSARNQDAGYRPTKSVNGIKCRSGFSTSWHTEYRNQGITRWPGVICQTGMRHHLAHCKQFCGTCLHGEHTVAWNFGPHGCRCYSKTQVRKITLTGTGWDFCTRTHEKSAAITNKQASGESPGKKEKKLNHALGHNATAPKKNTAFHTSNCPVKTLYPRTCWAESARKHCVKYPPQKAYEMVMAALPNQEKMYRLYRECLQKPSSAATSR